MKTFKTIIWFLWRTILMVFCLIVALAFLLIFDMGTEHMDSEWFVPSILIIITAVKAIYELLREMSGRVRVTIKFELIDAG